MVHYLVFKVKFLIFFTVLKLKLLTLLIDFRFCLHLKNTYKNSIYLKKKKKKKKIRGGENSNLTVFMAHCVQGLRACFLCTVS